MKSLLLLLSLCTSLPSLIYAQTGVYEYKSKSTKEDISLQLRRDGVFFYTYNKEWTNCTTQGTWRPSNNGRVILNSDYQLDDYIIKEEVLPNQKGITVVIQGRGKKEAPTTISSLYFNDNESLSLSTDGEAGFKALEQRQRAMMTSSPAVRDSIGKTDPPRFFKYNNAAAVKSITMKFDLKTITFPIKDPKANKIVITTAFAPNAAYKYMKDVEFVKDDKFIREEGSQIKLKKQKY